MENEIYEINLDSCYGYMKNWKKWYCKKNSKKKVTFIARIFHEANEPIFWKRYLELHIDGKMIQQERIRPEAYDTLTRDDKLPVDRYISVEFTTLFTFNP